MADRTFPQAPACAAQDEITIVHSRRRRLAKLIHADRSFEDYDSALRFDLSTKPVPDLSALMELLERLQGMPNCAVVRGAIADPTRTRGVRRLLHLDAATGDLPTLNDVARRVVALDMDSIPLPPEVDPQDLVACGLTARATLPPEFQAAELIVAATAGHTFKPGARLRLWGLLDAGLSGRQLREWLRDAPCDPAVFGAAQLIYTAAPVFENIGDPLTRRIVRLPGVERVESRLRAADAPQVDRPPTRPIRAGSIGRLTTYVMAAIDGECRAVAACLPGGRNQHLFLAAVRLGKLVGAGLVPEAVAMEQLAIAAGHCGLTDDDGARAVTSTIENGLSRGRASPRAVVA